MAICSNCNEVIDYLIYNIISTAGGSFSLEGFEENYDGDGNEEYKYKCPECDEVLFTEEGEARKFLEYKDKLKELVATKVNEKRNTYTEKVE